MARQVASGGAPAGSGVSLWVNGETHALLGELAKLEERPVQTILRRAVIAYAERSPEFQAWTQRGRKAAKAAKETQREAVAA